MVRELKHHEKKYVTTQNLKYIVHTRQNTEIQRLISVLQTSPEGRLPQLQIRWQPP